MIHNNYNYDCSERGITIFEVDGQKNGGQPIRTWRRQVQEEIREVFGLKKEVAYDRVRWKKV